MLAAGGPHERPFDIHFYRVMRHHEGAQYIATPMTKNTSSAPVTASLRLKKRRSILLLCDCHDLPQFAESGDPAFRRGSIYSSQPNIGQTAILEGQITLFGEFEVLYFFEPGMGHGQHAEHHDGVLIVRNPGRPRCRAALRSAGSVSMRLWPSKRPQSWDWCSPPRK
jgi:hypothetical protein